MFPALFLLAAFMAEYSSDIFSFALDMRPSTLVLSALAMFVVAGSR
jgi:hypothetical protein